MKPSEKILLKELKNNNLSTTGKIVLDIRSYYYESHLVLGSPVINEITSFLMSILSKDNINAYLLGYNDLINFFNIGQKYINKVPSIDSGTSASANIPNDKKYFFVIKDFLTKTFFINILGVDCNLEIQSLKNGRYKAGDLLILTGLNFYSPNFYWTETIISCDSIPYLTFTEICQKENITLNKILFDISHRFSALSYPLGIYSIPPQAEIPISIIKYDIFGNVKLDTFNLSAYQTTETYNKNFITIPLKTKLKNTLIGLPMAYDMEYFTISLYLTIN